MVAGSTSAMKKIGRSAYQITSDRGTVVIKSQPPAHGWLRKASRLFFGGSLPFQNERVVNSILMQNSFLYLNYPKPIGISSDGDMEFEYIEGNDLSDPSMENIHKAMNGLLEFNCLGEKYRFPGIRGAALRVLESPLIRTARFLLYSDLSFKQKISGLCLISHHLIRAPMRCKVLLHNDLLFSNLRVGNSGDIYFLDFEDATLSSMVLADAIDLLINRSELTLDLGKLRDYWLRLASRIGVDHARLNLADQTRLCLLRLSIAGRKRSASSVDQRSKMDALCKIVLDNKAFDSWVRNQLIDGKQINQDES